MMNFYFYLKVDEDLGLEGWYVVGGGQAEEIDVVFLGDVFAQLFVSFPHQVIHLVLVGHLGRMC